MNMIFIKTYFIYCYFVSFADSSQGFFNTFFHRLVEQCFPVFYRCYHMVTDFVYTMRSFFYFHNDGNSTIAFYPAASGRGIEKS